MQPPTDDSSDDEDKADAFMDVSHHISDGNGDVFSIIAELCYGHNNTVDLFELCGGTAGISKAAFKRSLSSGGNLDLTTGCDLGNPSVQQAVLHYLDTCYVLVTVVQPNCRTLGKLSNINSTLYPDSWLNHHEEDLPHIKFCGKVAAHQRSLGRYWLREQPAGTWIDSIPPWNDVVCDPDVDRCLMDQCMAGCVDDWGIPVKKRTEWTANHQALLVYLKKFQCDGSHAHSTPTGKALEKLKHYPVGVCNAVVKGIIELKKDVA